VGTETLRGAELWFGLLGPLEVRRGPDSVRLAGERQRALLALLLMTPNQLVLTDVIVEQLFGGQPGEPTLNALWAAVSRLRKQLRLDGEAAPITRLPGGYLLAVAPEQLDVTRFERLVEDGCAKRRDGDSVRAAATLREALELWRGDPFADLTGVEFAEAEIRRLRGLRDRAVTERIDADLALGRDGSLVGEIQELIGRDPLSERSRGQLMLALYRAGRQSDALEVYRETHALLGLELGLEPGPPLRSLQAMILRQDATLDSARRVREAESGAPATPLVCPFKGLAPFERSDADFFAGRETVVSGLVTRAASGTLVGVVGPSGVGKSSIIRAGLLPMLGAGILPGSARWRQVIAQPGPAPVAGLQRALGGSVDAVLDAVPDGERLVIVVDQLEELASSGADETERDQFLDLLVTAAGDAARRALVVVALRADRYGAFAEHEAFAEQLSASHTLVGPMARSELRRAIELPAQRAGLIVEPALAAALVEDVIGEPSALPLLSTMLLELWRDRDDDALTLARYLDSGGVHGAVGRLAEAVMARLSAVQAGIARRVLLRLVAGTGDDLVRRQARRAELLGLDGSEAVLEELIAGRLVRIEGDTAELAHEALLREWPRMAAWLAEERVHREALSHLASSAREWDAHGRDPSELYRGARLQTAVELMRSHRDEFGSDERDFVAASEADAAGEADRQRSLNRRLRGLLGLAGVLLILVVAGAVVAVVKQHTAARAERSARHAQQVEGSDARTALARELGAEAVSEPRIDLAMLLAREGLTLHSDPQTQSTLLATLLRSPAVVGTVALPIQARPQRVSVSPDGRTLVIPDNTGRLRFYDARSLRPTHILTDPGSTDAPAFSPDGRLIAYLAQAGGHFFIAIRDARTLALRRRLPFDRLWLGRPSADDPDSALAFSHDGRVLYYGYWTQTPEGTPERSYLDRWSVSGGPARRVTLGPGSLDYGLTNRGTRLTALVGRRAVTMRARTLRRVSSTAIRGLSAGPEYETAFSPNGRSATIGDQDGRVVFADLRTGRIRAGDGGHTGWVQNVLYTPDGRSAITTGADGRIVVWNPRTAQPRVTLSGQQGEVHGAAVTSDGQTLYTSALDGTVLKWALGARGQFGRTFAFAPRRGCCADVDPLAPELAIAPDGEMFAVTTGTRTVELASTATLRPVAHITLPPTGGEPTSLAFSPNGRLLAVGAHAGAVTLWSVTHRPRLIRRLQGLAGKGPADEQAVPSLAFSANGSRLAAASAAGPGVSSRARVLVWRVGDASRISTWLSSADSSVVAFAPDGKTLAVGGQSGRVTLLDPARGTVRRTLSPIGAADQEPISTLAYAPDGTLATGSWTGVVQLWSPAGRNIGSPRLVANAPVADVAFSRDGTRLLTTGGSDGTTKLWFTSGLRQEGSTIDPDPGTWASAAFIGGSRILLIHDDGTGMVLPGTPRAWARHACAVAGRNLTREEWSRYVQATDYRAACPSP
jgi:WD40 repeat protein/DNA-binding SARP family transcriptional activator